MGEVDSTFWRIAIRHEQAYNPHLLSWKFLLKYNHLQ
jgi:hypothetical protein